MNKYDNNLGRQSMTCPAHKPVKRSTLSHILKQARLNVDKLLELL